MTTRVAPDPDTVRRHNELSDLYHDWPGRGDPDDDPEFVAQAWQIMGLTDDEEVRVEAAAGHEDIPDEAEFALARAWLESVGEPVQAAAGHDVTPGNDELHHWWVYGKGRALWKTWTELVAALVERVEGKSLETLKTWASRWFFERYGYYAGSDINRVKHGKPPRGDRIGPG